MTLSHDAAGIRIAANAPVFDLPILVALELGMFRKAGLRVTYLDHPLPAADIRRAEPRFEAHQADIYNLDAWSGVERIGHGGRVARVTAMRPAIVAQAIVSFDETLYNPHDLACVEIGVNLRRASHYATLQLVSGSLPAEVIRVRDAGGPDERLRLLVAGHLRAATLMEPHLSLALDQGAHIVAMTFYRGAEMMGAEVSEDQADAYYDVINDAVDTINADFDRFRPLLVAPLAGALPPEKLGRTFLRYAHAESYDDTTARKLHPSIRAWDAIPAREQH